MSDADKSAAKYLQRFPSWEKTLQGLPGLGKSINPLLRAWWCEELEYLPVHTVLWRMAQGLIPVRNFGKTGQRRLREALREAGVPMPVMSERGPDHQVKFALPVEEVCWVILNNGMTLCGEITDRQNGTVYMTERLTGDKLYIPEASVAFFRFRPETAAAP